MGDRFVVVEHMNGELALAVSQISSVWRDGADGAAATLRLNSPALSEAKTVGGEAADSLWKSFSGGHLASQFVVVSHMGGSLALPRDQISTAFYSSEGAARLRLVYAGDPDGKTLEGEEAKRVWTLLTEPPG